MIHLILKKKKLHFNKNFVCYVFFVSSGAMIVYGLFAICSSIYSFITENKIKKEYNQTYATLVKYIDCKLDEDNIEICNAIYKYEVNNNIYTVTLDLDVIQDVYENSEIVYYNPNNPNESVIYPNNNIYRIFVIIFGIVIICLGIFIILFTTAIIKTIKEPKKIIN